jgi:hypothetical protein
MKGKIALRVGVFMARAGNAKKWSGYECNFFQKSHSCASLSPFFNESTWQDTPTPILLLVPLKKGLRDLFHIAEPELDSSGRGGNLCSKS